MLWKLWLHGLIGAVVTGSATTVGAAIGSNAAGSPLDLKATGGAALAGAIVGAILYLKQSPLPPDTPQK